MYPYHNRIKQRISNGELADFCFTDDYPRIGECFVLIFSTAPHRRSIRPRRYAEYQKILTDWREKNG